jgi:hypothetical protein
VVADELQSPLVGQPPQPGVEPDRRPGGDVAAHLPLGVAEDLLHHVGGVEARLEPGVGGQVPGDLPPQPFAVVAEQGADHVQVAVGQSRQEGRHLLGVRAHR